jgi:hypothetical protein
MRRTRMLALSTIALLGSLAFGACAESPTAPDLRAPAAEGLLGDLVGDVVGTVTSLIPGGSVNVLKRSEPMPTEEKVTKTIGSAGGTIYLPRGGLTVTIPRDALSSNTAITVTAPAGNLMGYHFAPHGLVFKKSVTMKQDLTKTELGLLGRLLNAPKAAYFLGELRPQVTALELLGLNINGLFGYATFNVKHFSGYVIATD